MKKIITTLLFGVLVAVVWSYRDYINQDQVELWLERAGLWAPLFFILLYALATVLFIPGTVLTIVGGALFGPIYGSLINLTGATIGASFAFLISRYLVSDWVKQRAGDKITKILDGVDSEGWRFVAFTRLVPLFPFTILNYVLGLTKIPLLHYIVATWIFMLPGAFAYTYLGYAGSEAFKGGESLVQNIMIALTLIAIVAFIPRLIKKIRKQLR
ncbi:MAG: TVP38/TMEM64 family protein [Thiotrichales bacterium]|nr:TVP38/TMEM64 family protein [Thiotrichales bacterium]MBT3613273.1 TVP38/TMEM64 family protein [Thiotrichales bacterium]MBT3751822.1 TVP38/TMEM64 family protein [Thiotrichales bacterium]MBT3838047.1 TVP38/TMEM64 family protein [Thiotrichales bacterium]MBT4152040.1 TVP38/TMEM64 family protein [Thiotrichales bacterium]